MAQHQRAEHEWQHAGTQMKDGTHYTKWACHCGAFKIVSVEFVSDDSGTFADPDGGGG